MAKFQITKSFQFKLGKKLISFNEMTEKGSKMEISDLRYQYFQRWAIMNCILYKEFLDNLTIEKENLSHYPAGKSVFFISF